MNDHPDDRRVDQLRAYLDGYSSFVPKQLSPIRVRRRLAAVVLSTVASVAVVGVFVAAFLLGHSALRSSAPASTPTPVPSGSPLPAHFVPWLPLPPANANPQATLDPATSPVLPVPPGTPPCRAGQLEGVHMAGSGAAGNRDDPVELRNRSNTTCVLTGYPDISILDRSGKVLARASGSSSRGTYFDAGDVVPVLMKIGTPHLPPPDSSGWSSNA